MFTQSAEMSKARSPGRTSPDRRAADWSPQLRTSADGCDEIDGWQPIKSCSRERRTYAPGLEQAQAKVRGACQPPRRKKQYSSGCISRADLQYRLKTQKTSQRRIFRSTMKQLARFAAPTPAVARSLQKMPARSSERLEAGVADATSDAGKALNTDIQIQSQSHVLRGSAAPVLGIGR